MFSSDARARARGTASTFLTVLLAVHAVSCSRNPAPAVLRLGIPRFENLTGEDSLNWTGRAVSEVIATEIAGSRTISVLPFARLHGADGVLGPRPLTAPGVSTERPAALLSGASRILYGRVSRTSGKVRLDAALYDPASQKVALTLTAVGSGPEDVIRMADSLARGLATDVRAFETRNAGALEQYCAGIDSRDPAVAAQAFSRAVATDPNFGEPYVAWAQLAVSQNNKPEAERILTLAAGRGKSIPELERARLSAIGAELSGDFAAAAGALSTVARLNPSDVDLLRQLAQSSLNARRYREAADDLKKILALDPGDPVVLNQLGYAEMYEGNLPEATKALAEYARLRPADPNALDSLGEVNFYLGRFDAAEKYFRAAYDKDNTFNGGAALLKAAYARLMTGDVPGADSVFKRYLDARRNAKDALIEFRQSEWEFLSGRRSQAVERLDAYARGLPPAIAPAIAPQANAQLALWKLELGDRAKAREFALRAASQSNVTAPAVIARFLTEPPAPPSEWNARAERMLPGPAQAQIRKTLLAYVLLLQKEFQAAEPILLDLYQHSAPEPQQGLPVLLAWAQRETGHPDQAALLIDRNPVPNPAPEMFKSLAFPRLLFLRAAVLESRQQRDDAARNFRLFLTLSGPDAIVFGEEAKARQAIAK